jgi:hypothetical protein
VFVIRHSYGIQYTRRSANAKGRLRVVSLRKLRYS